MIRDPRLDRVAVANSDALAEVSGRAPGGADAHLKFLLEKEGVRDAVVQGVVRELGSQKPPAVLQAVLAQRRLGEFTHFGVGCSGGGRIMTLVLVRRLVQVAISRGRQKLSICVTLTPTRPVHSPRLLVTLPRSWHFERRISGRKGCVSLRRQRGRHQVEVMVEGRFGPEVAALFPLYVDTPAPAFPVHKLYPQHQQGHVEIRLMRWLNRSRRAAGLPVLSPSKRLASVARSHSQDMLLSGYFGHVSPREGDLAHRLARSGVSYHQASENLALAARPLQAHESLMSSPGHRRTILDPAATHVGVGVAADPARGLLYVTQIIARFQVPARPTGLE